MTYHVTVTLRSGSKIEGTTDGHPVLQEGMKGNLVTLRMLTDDGMDTIITEYEPGQKIKAAYWTSVYKPNIGGSVKIISKLDNVEVIE